MGQSLGWEILIRNQLLGKEGSRSRNEQEEKEDCNVGPTQPRPARGGGWGGSGVIVAGHRGPGSCRNGWVLPALFGDRELPRKCMPLG